MQRRGLRRHGSLPPRVPKPEPTYSVDGWRGMCKVHYRRVLKHGDPRRDGPSEENLARGRLRRRIEEREDEHRMAREVADYPD